MVQSTDYKIYETPTPQNRMLTAKVKNPAHGILTAEILINFAAKERSKLTGYGTETTEE